MESNSSIFLQILDLGFKQTSVSYDKEERKAGISKWTFKKKLKLAIDSFVSFSFAPIRLVTIAGIIMAVLAFVYGVFLIFFKLFGGQVEYGWSGLIVILMFCFGITNITLGIIAEYLWRTLDVSRRRSLFVLDEVKDLN